MKEIFSVAQVKALCGGNFPQSEGFSWERVEHFVLENGLFQPFSENNILPGPALQIEIIPEDTAKKFNYRIMASHCTDPEEKDREFEADNDGEAKVRFAEIASSPNYGMDYLRLLRIDVKEETTYLSYAERKNGRDKPPEIKHLG